MPHAFTYGRVEVPAVIWAPNRNGASGATDQATYVEGRFLICKRLAGPNQLAPVVKLSIEGGDLIEDKQGGVTRI